MNLLVEAVVNLAEVLRIAKRQLWGTPIRQQIIVQAFKPLKMWHDLTAYIKKQIIYDSPISRRRVWPDESDSTVHILTRGHP